LKVFTTESTHFKLVTEQQNLKFLEILDDVSNLANEFLENFSNSLQKRNERNQELMKQISELLESNEREKQKINKAADLSQHLNSKLGEISKL
jgi:response regulator RpfG family c-di-GMP phosphodiesterase